MPIRPRLLGLFACFVLCGSALGQPAKWEFKDGDRVVFLGNTLIEQEQRSGHWETALTTRFPERNVTFRNLGWSGDTVWGEARAGFGSVADGFRQLHEHVFALKPTVLFISYGTNEAFDGSPGLERFVAGYERLLDTLAPTKARIVLISPLRQEKLPPQQPDPSAINHNLGLYVDAIRKLAEKRGLRFINLFDQPAADSAGKSRLLTHNGMHLTEEGYRVTSLRLLGELGLTENGQARWQIEVDATAVPRPVLIQGTRGEVPVFAVRTQDSFLPLLGKAGGQVILVRGLGPGAYRLLIDGVEAQAGPAEIWRAGAALGRSPDESQAEELRQKIIAKNELYFHRWRPQNETYLFGFRKHEQGQNAKEIVQFDPLIAAAEAEIARLRKPRSHSYELLRVEEK